MSAQAQPRLSPEEYLEIERAASTRSEYFNGRMYAMSGGTFKNSRIGPNLSAELSFALKKSLRGCIKRFADSSFARRTLYVSGYCRGMRRA
jgi:Uma2 family endonuclease